MADIDIDTIFISSPVHGKRYSSVAHRVWRDVAAAIATAAAAACWPRRLNTSICFGCCRCFYFIFIITCTFHRVATKAVVTGVVPSPPPGTCLHFFYTEGSAFPTQVDFRRILLTRALSGVACCVPPSFGMHNVNVSACSFFTNMEELLGPLPSTAVFSSV